jgi:hypothetical protein
MTLTYNLVFMEGSVCCGISDDVQEKSPGVISVGEINQVLLEVEINRSVIQNFSFSMCNL